jgi:uncharacterized protein with von Willebrand factor type A (vWA) domain
MKTASTVLAGNNYATKSLSTLRQAIQQTQTTERETLIICDCSGSMDGSVANGQRRIDILRAAVKEARGKIVSFSARAEFTAAPREPKGGTDYVNVLEFSAPHARGKRVVFISDGEPDSEEAAYEAAKIFPAKIETVFCGNPGSDGERILKEIARLTSGAHVATISWETPQLFSPKIRGLLAA